MVNHSIDINKFSLFKRNTYKAISFMATTKRSHDQSLRVLRQFDINESLRD